MCMIKRYSDIVLRYFPLASRHPALRFRRYHPPCRSLGLMETLGIKRLPVTRGSEVVIETVSRVNSIAALLKIWREDLWRTVLDVEKGGSASKPSRGFKELKTY
jgi:hypothetical protein